jgi:hypothetical protein
MRRRPRHSRTTRLTSISAALSQLPCFGVNREVHRETMPERIALPCSQRDGHALERVRAEVVDDEMDGACPRIRACDSFHRRRERGAGAVARRVRQPPAREYLDDADDVRGTAADVL